MTIFAFRKANVIQHEDGWGVRGKSRGQLRNTAIMQGDMMSAGVRMVAVEKERWKGIWEMGLV